MPEFIKPTIEFTPEAWSKMTTLIMGFSTEIGWHGVVSRDGYKFTISDILVFPQEVAAATVTADQKKYEQWLMNLPDEQFNGLRMHGHSHVNMGTTPSGTDADTKEKIIEQLGKDDFYIFLIWNKSLDFTAEIYDCTTMLKYTNSWLDITVQGIGSVKEFLKNTKEIVTERTYAKWTYQNPSNFSTRTTSLGKEYTSSGVGASAQRSLSNLPDWEWKD